LLVTRNRFERVHGSLRRKTAGAGGAGTGADMDQDDGPPEDFDDMGFVSSVLQARPHDGHRNRHSHPWTFACLQLSATCTVWFTNWPKKMHQAH
jgi:hypothetical protein